jgi:hypothetical protein
MVDMMEVTTTQDSFLHHAYSEPDDSDSEMAYPPSSAITSEVSSLVPSEASSAVASESELPSAATSESELPSAVASESNLHLPKIKQSRSKIQAGIQNFFRVLTKDEVQALQVKRKRATSDDEASRAEHIRKEKERKVNHRREGNRLSQQRHREKLKKVEIKQGIRDSDGNLIKVS